MNKNSILITIISIIAVFAFLTGAYYLTSQPTETKVYADINKVKQDDHVKWAKKGKALLVEYSDLQCPACRSMHELIKNQIEQNPQNKAIMSKVTFVYRHFPLTQHQHSFEASLAAEAAGKQGKFFEMADLMFSRQDKWETDKNVNAVFETYAKELNLNEVQFKKDRDSQEVKQRVERDQNEGVQANVQATPTFFLNGKAMQYATFDDFIKQLETAIK